MADTTKLYYIVVLDDKLQVRDDQSASSQAVQNHYFRYTCAILQTTLQFMGCKTRHAFKISKKVFEIIKEKVVVDFEKKICSVMDAYQLLCHVQEDFIRGFCIENEQVRKRIDSETSDCGSDTKNQVSHKKRLVAVLRRHMFLDIVCDALAEYRYVGPNQRTDLIIACRLRERKESITVLLCGASGCGKSTLSSLLASRLGITTVVSTDSIRHMMRGFMNENENPLLFASTYHAGECLDPIDVAKAKARKKEKKIIGSALSGQSVTSNFERISDTGRQVVDFEAQDSLSNDNKKDKLDMDMKKVNVAPEMISPKAMAIEGYKAQSEMVMDSLDRLITIWEERKESVVIEGVHLSLNFVMGLMRKHPSIIPFMIYIANEEKHLERFAVRAKYMTLDPSKNRYVKYIRNIRTIQDYLCKRAEKHLVPKINNTNVDKSVASIHATIFSCLRRRAAGEQLYDQSTNTVKLVDEEYRNCCAGNTLSSKGMFKLIQRQGSYRQLMALVNTDGSVAKAWPIGLADTKSSENANPRCNNIGSPLYGPLQIGKEEPVNLQFGKFGISSWPDDAAGTSHAHANNLDENEQPSQQSSHSNSPRQSDGPAKEPIGGSPVSVSDEEAEVTHGDDEDDLSDTSIKEDELGGSVDEGSARSDEGSDDIGSYDDDFGEDWSENLEGNDLKLKGSMAVLSENGSQPDTVESASLDNKLDTSNRPPVNKMTMLEKTNNKHSQKLQRRSKSASLKCHKLKSRSRSLPALDKYSLSSDVMRS